MANKERRDAELCAALQPYSSSAVHAPMEILGLASARDAPPNKPMQLAARFFKRKVIVVMNWARFSNSQRRLARWLVTPQLMGRAVSRPETMTWSGTP